MTINTWQVLAIGFLSTLSIDLLTGVAIRLRLVAPLSPHLIGRDSSSAAWRVTRFSDSASGSPFER